MEFPDWHLKINIPELLCSAYVFVTCFKLLKFSSSCARLKLFVRCPLYTQEYWWTCLKGGLLKAKSCRGLAQSNATGLVVPQQHFILWYSFICCSLCEVPCYSAIMFDFAMVVSGVAKNLNAFCIKVMYILIYSDTNETYIYIIVK